MFCHRSKGCQADTKWQVSVSKSNSNFPCIKRMNADYNGNDIIEPICADDVDFQLSKNYKKIKLNLAAL